MSDANGSSVPSGPALAKDLFEDMGRKVESMKLNNQQDGPDTERKMLDEIESLCMNCHDDVSGLMAKLKPPC